MDSANGGELDDVTAVTGQISVAQLLAREAHRPTRRGRDRRRRRVITGAVVGAVAVAATVTGGLLIGHQPGNARPMAAGDHARHVPVPGVDPGGPTTLRPTSPNGTPTGGLPVMAPAGTPALPGITQRRPARQPARPPVLAPLPIPGTATPPAARNPAPATIVAVVAPSSAQSVQPPFTTAPTTTPPATSVPSPPPSTVDSPTPTTAPGGLLRLLGLLDIPGL